jgi:hypothetical protein
MKGIYSITLSILDVRFVFIYLIALFMHSCSNGDKKPDAEQKIDSIILKLPKCKDYSFVGYKKVNKDVIVNMNCMSEFYDPITEREYFLYIVKNLIPYFERENIDSVKAIFTYPIQGNRILDFSFSANLVVRHNSERDSIKRPIYCEIVEKVVNDSDFRFKTVCFQYEYGKTAFGKSYEFYDNADVFVFYLSINDEVLYTHKRDNLKVLVKLLYRHDDRDYQEFIRYLIGFYPKSVVEEELRLYRK